MVYSVKELSKIKIVYKKKCVVCGSEFDLNYPNKKYCSKKCCRKSNREQPKYPYLFRESSIKYKFKFYTEKEIELGMYIIKKVGNLLDVLPCRCQNNEVCYPHYLENLRSKYGII